MLTERLERSVCRIDLTFLTLGQVFCLLSPYMPVQISLISYVQHVALDLFGVMQYILYLIALTPSFPFFSPGVSHTVHAPQET